MQKSVSLSRFFTSQEFFDSPMSREQQNLQLDQEDRKLAEKQHLDFANALERSRELRFRNLEIEDKAREAKEELASKRLLLVFSIALTYRTCRSSWWQAASPAVSSSSLSSHPKRRTS